MKKISLMITMLAMISLLTVSVLASAVGAGAAAEQESYTLEEMLQYALEDERLAMAEYEAIIEEFDVTRPFSNIVRAEKRHEEAVIGLYESRGLIVPEFDGSEFVVIPDSLEEIYTIGVEAEINNIAMYESFLAQDLDEDVELVFTALMEGSKNHLAAFERAAEGESGKGMESNQGNGNSEKGGRGNGRGNKNQGNGQSKGKNNYRNEEGQIGREDCFR